MAVGNAVIGALQVLVGADTAEMETGLKKAQKSLQDFSNKVSEAGRLAAAGFVLATAALSVAIKGTINEADKLYKMSQSFGVPIEELSALKHAADLSGVSLESLGKALAKLSRNMMDAAANPTGEAAKAFQALGISVKNADGSLKSSSVVMTEVAEKFAGFRDGAAKTALAIALFGRAGADLIPLLNQGKTGLQGMIDEAKELGIVIDQRTGAAAEAFNDNLTRMRKVFDGIVIKVTAEMLPAFLRFSEILLETSKNSDFMKAASSGLITALQGGVTVVATLINLYQRLAIEFSAIGQAIEQFKKLNFTAGWALYMKGQEDSVKKFEELNDYLKKFQQESAAAVDQLVKKPVAQNEAPIIQGNKDALDKYIDSIKKKNAATQADLETIGLSEGAHQRLKIILEAEAIAKENNIVITEKMRAKLNESANATGMLADQLERTRERWDNFRSAVLSVRTSLENAFTDAILQAKSFKEIIRSLISDLARMAAQQAFRSMFGGAGDWTRLAGGLFGGGGATAGASMGGLAGFATGGSFKVGGSGGIDSQLVAFKASPNERVTISKPGQEMGGGVTIHQTIAPVFHPGMTPTDMASIRSMMSTVSEQTKNETINSIRGAMSRDSRAFAL